MSSMAWAIETAALRKRFGQTRAVEGIDLQIRRGTAMLVIPIR